MKYFEKTLMLLGIIYIIFGTVFAIVGVGSALVIDAARKDWVEMYGVISDFSNNKISDGDVNTGTYVSMSLTGMRMNRTAITTAATSISVTRS